MRNKELSSLRVVGASVFAGMLCFLLTYLSFFGLMKWLITLPEFRECYLSLGVEHCASNVLKDSTLRIVIATAIGVTFAFLNGFYITRQRTKSILKNTFFIVISYVVFSGPFHFIGGKFVYLYLAIVFGATYLSAKINQKSEII